jgi:bacillopeptidase F (M6 metalloprotease family)
MWPNSKIQIDNSAGGVLAHEIGHCLGAPDVYRLGRYNDGIGGGATC